MNACAMIQKATFVDSFRYPVPSCLAHDCREEKGWRQKHASLQLLEDIPNTFEKASERNIFPLFVWKKIPSVVWHSVFSGRLESKR